MDDSKELIDYMFEEIKSIIPENKECKLEYMQNDKDVEEVLFTYGDKSFQDIPKRAVSYIRGVRDTFKFYNDCSLERLIGES